MPAKGTFGNEGRNTLIGPGLNTTHLSLFKNSKFGENKSVQFRAEIFNIANHPNLDFPDTNFSSQQFGQIFSAQVSRQIQFGLKLNY